MLAPLLPRAKRAVQIWELVDHRITSTTLSTPHGTHNRWATIDNETLVMTAESFSIQPWARPSKDSVALKDVLARLNFERGHFRDITEASLQEEIAAEGALTLSEDEEDNDEAEEVDNADDTKSKPKTREELYKAKYELQSHVNAAHQEILMAVDFISLLLSKDAPKQGLSTMSQALKQQLSPGTLGVDIWQRMPTDRAREAQDEVLATNLRIQGLQESADALLSAATRLQDIVRKETAYWDQVLKISEGGWNVCRIPGQHHKLGVRFGFMESSPEFSRRGVAALNSNSTGKVSLERGVGQKPRALHVALRKGKRVVGTSKLPAPPDAEGTTLEARIRYARDSLYDEELYHEMIRESRALTSLSVSMVGSAIQFQSSTGSADDLTISFDLTSLDDDGSSLRYDPANLEDRMAQATAIAARLLLTQAHRDRLKRRSQLPAPLSDKTKEEKPLLPLLRPLIALVMQQTGLRSLNTYLADVQSVLSAAKIEVNGPGATLQIPVGDELTNSDSLMRLLLQPWSSEAWVKVGDAEGNEMTFSFIVRTELATSNSFGTTFSLRTPSQDAVYRFDSFKELSSATDTMLSSAMAEACLPVLGEGWTCNKNEALLIKEGGVGEKSESMWVVLCDGGRKLSLNSHGRGLEWSADGTSPGVCFWEEARERSRPADR